LVGADLQNASLKNSLNREELSQLFCANARKALKYNKAFRFPQAIKDLASPGAPGDGCNLTAA
jgi:hypothetical protein